MSKKEARENSGVKDFLSPIDLEKLGTEDDPCFGDFDAKAPECKLCGDSQLCQIFQAQQSNVTRAKLEAKQKFKDVEMEVKTHYLDQKDVTKIIKKAAKKGKLSKGKVFRLVQKQLDPKKRVENEHIQKLIISAVRNTDGLKFIKEKNKRYIIWTK